MSRISPAVWVVAVAGFFGGHVVASWKWKMLVGACGLRFPFDQALRAHAAGLFANLCLPSIVGGDVVRAGLVVRRHGHFEVVALGSLVDRIVDIVTLCLLAGTGGLVLIREIDGVTILIPMVVGIVVLLGLVAIGGATLLIPKERLPAVLAPFASRVIAANQSLIRHPGVALMGLILSIGIQSVFVLLNIVIASAMGIQVNAWVWFLAWPLAKIIALIPVSLGGIGVRELALAGLLAPFGVGAVDAVAQSLSWEVVLVTSGLVAGSLALFLGKAPWRERAKR
jgi:uncharacterized membrane protein YbhN (UPF0104 family)